MGSRRITEPFCLPLLFFGLEMPPNPAPAPLAAGFSGAEEGKGSGTSVSDGPSVLPRAFPPSSGSALTETGSTLPVVAEEVTVGSGREEVDRGGTFRGERCHLGGGCRKASADAPSIFYSLRARPGVANRVDIRSRGEEEGDDRPKLKA